LPEDHSKEDRQCLEKLDLYDPQSVSIKAIYKLYTMNSYLPKVLNEAASEYDFTKVESIGCFAAVLSRSLQWTQR